ncbi:TetR family transcriptional regulator [Alkalibaculum sp. M08DMB]|uniref:TetR family transcriptional regulator n=1 Tax=Alkalibaculum sporogenes TaxID=2655001 RepID=A0A6A7KBN1_9FIRM|nr:TetR/AcrR family transcriptional regulator [Alkalibaculum sporogenes]MPW26762.1 TetR family transcriptional regulator [Alkalibaculum sporogenes]
MYIKGQNKKEEIYLNAKQLLYELGYTNTTIKLIAEVSDSPVSLVHYYFKKKDEIIRAVYYDFLNNIHFFLHIKNPHIFKNYILSHAVTSRIFYDIILNNERNRRVYHEVLLNKSNYSIMNKYTSKIYKNYIKDNDLIISDELFEMYSVMDFGARREFFINYFEGNIDISVQEIVSALNGLLPRLYKLNQHFVDSLMMDSLSIYNSLDYSEIKFLL